MLFLFSWVISKADRGELNHAIPCFRETEGRQRRRWDALMTWQMLYSTSDLMRARRGKKFSFPVMNCVISVTLTLSSILYKFPHKTRQNLELQATYIYLKKAYKMKRLWTCVLKCALHYFILFDLCTLTDFSGTKLLKDALFLPNRVFAPVTNEAVYLWNVSNGYFWAIPTKEKYFCCLFSSAFDKISGWSAWIVQLRPSLRSLKIDWCSCCAAAGSPCMFIQRAARVAAYAARIAVDVIDLRTLDAHLSGAWHT